MTTTKITIVGGGSYNWSPIILRDLAAMPGLGGTIVLQDINPEALEDIRRLGQQIMAATGSAFAVEATTNLDEALRGAEFVVVTITTGGLEAMAHDLDIPRKYGIYQAVGDTVGPGGLSRALRNIPVMLEIARAMERVCPDAWMLNLTNPMTTLTRAVTKTTSIKTVGLCHELFGVRRTLKEMFDAENEEFAFKVAGVNHMTWLLDLKIRGEDGVELLRGALRDGRPIPLKATSGAFLPPFQDRWGVKLALLDLYGYLPGAGDRHVAEFFPGFLTMETNAGADYGVLLTEIPHRREMGRAARESVQAWLSGAEPLPTGRSEEPVADIVDALASGRSLYTIVNLPNSGQIANLPKDAVVETMGVIGPTGAAGVSVGELPPALLGTILPHVVNQELIVEAAITGDRRLALQALVGDPLMRDFRAAPKLLDELLAAHAQHLPQFP
jgi:alpha-galactosidase/6-phospho-beta-glucosidase family protein